MAERTSSRYLDTIGAAASTACAVHCLLTPIVIGVLPLLGIGFLASEWFENTAVVVAITLGLISLIHGYSHHHQFRAFGLLSCGIVLLITGRWIVGDDFQIIETGLVVMGGLAVAGAHWTNRRLLCQTCDACHTFHGLEK